MDIKTKVAAYYDGDRSGTPIDMAIRAIADIKDEKEVINMDTVALDVAIPSKNARVYNGNCEYSFDGKPVYDCISTGPSDNKKVMSPEEFAERMNALDKMDYSKFDSTVHPENIEERHMEADNLMARLLESLGYEEGVQTFLMMHKYYI